MKLISNELNNDGLSTKGSINRVFQMIGFSINNQELKFLVISKHSFQI